MVEVRLMNVWVLVLVRLMCIISVFGDGVRLSFFFGFLLVLRYLMTMCLVLLF